MAAATATASTAPSTRSEVSKLFVYWDIPSDLLTNHIAISIQIGLNKELTTSVRTFVLPPSLKAVGLDVGSGIWFTRVGFWTGTPTKGTIVWGDVSEAVEVKCAKTPVPIPKVYLPVIHTTLMIEGVRFHFSDALRRYVVYEKSETPSFGAAVKVSYYKLHNSADFDIMDLTPTVPIHLRVAMLATLDPSTLPTSTVEMLGGWSAALNKRPLKKPRDLDNVSRLDRVAMAVVDDGLSKQPHKGDKPKFSSHTDYLRYQSALARAGQI